MVRRLPGSRVRPCSPRLIGASCRRREADHQQHRRPSKSFAALTGDRARQKSLNRTVALKIIGLGQWASKAHIKRCRLDAEAAASLDHPCIVPVYEVGERNGSCYFSIKLIEGGQLDEVAERAPMSVRQAAEFMAKVARTVHYAHEHGILLLPAKHANGRESAIVGRLCQTPRRSSVRDIRVIRGVCKQLQNFPRKRSQNFTQYINERPEMTL